MLKLCETQTLLVVKKVEFGVYLTESEGDRERVLLPKSGLPVGLEIGDEVNAFLYRDSKDRLIATLKEPKIVLRKPAVLRVTDITKIGAFLDWGLEKELFLPYKEMTREPKRGDEILVRLYIDRSNRPAASMRGIYDLLSTRAPYVTGDEVQARIYEFGHDFGTFVAVSDKYSAMLPKHEDVSGYRIGDVLTVRITGVKEDGKLDVSLRKKAHEQIDEDANKVFSLIESYAGVLPFTEKADPEVIKRETGLSKNAFKRAVGHLYKERKITLDDGRIRIKESEV